MSQTDDTIAAAGNGWMLFDQNARTGPYALQELADMLREGSVSATAQVWQEGMAAWLPITTVLASPSPATSIGYASASPSQRRRQSKLAAYRRRVGHRSFIFQIWLLLWTVSYAAFLFFQAANLAHIFSPPAGTGPSAPAAPTPFDPLTALAGVSTGLMCLMVGWGAVGLPVGIAAVATMENNG